MPTLGTYQITLGPFQEFYRITTTREDSSEMPTIYGIHYDTYVRIDSTYSKKDSDYRLESLRELFPDTKFTQSKRYTPGVAPYRVFRVRKSFHSSEGQQELSDLVHFVTRFPTLEEAQNFVTKRMNDPNRIHEYYVSRDIEPGPPAESTMQVPAPKLKLSEALALHLDHMFAEHKRREAGVCTTRGVNMFKSVESIIEHLEEAYRHAKLVELYDEQETGR